VSRYFFHITNGQDLPDDTGMIFAGAKEARYEAIQTASQVLRGDRVDFWNSPEWTMRVTDEAGNPVFTNKRRLCITLPN
jgi:hypothetical protein